MSCRQNQQKCQLPAKCFPKCPPKCPPQAPQAPQAPAPCTVARPAPCPVPAPGRRVPSCCLSALGDCCCLLSHRLPGVCLDPPQPSTCCERETSGCSGCCHGLGGCS
uniref:Uncharacterized protein n=1 Tax=Molossus molossus TaxID=27622 RepID=A0A7J8CP41_MOLMO|nr:hypothetical protein HJG59_000563 [Molossus molossus]